MVCQCFSTFGQPLFLSLYLAKLILTTPAGHEKIGIRKKKGRVCKYPAF
jgi:hypothetical protein